MKLPHFLRASASSLLFLVGAAVLSGQSAPASPSLPVSVLVQSPAETKTELQIICLFRSSAENALHGSLKELDEKLHGLLTQVRTPGLFGGELGETLLLVPPPGSVAAHRILIIGLGDSATFAPERMYLVGKIAIREADRLGIVHPFFAPTVIDGGVSKYSTAAVAYQVVRGFLDATANEALLQEKNAVSRPSVLDFAYLAGPAHAKDTQAGIGQAMKR